MSRAKVVSPNNSINPLESLMNILPCNRPIKSIQIIENIHDCPENFIPLHKTLDCDSDADFFKENILFGKRNTRYICISKTEGPPNFVLEKLRIISASEHLASDGFISIKQTSDTNQKAWRKKQLVYKLSKTENVTECITDIVILTKFKNPAPEGFTYLGELEKVHICYKTSPIQSAEIIDFTKQIENLKIQSTLYPSMNNTEHYYESLKLSYHLPPTPPAAKPSKPLRQAPLPPNSPNNNVTINNNHNSNVGTLSSHYQTIDCVGIPFTLHPRLNKIDCSYTLPTNVNVQQSELIDYDFNLERQILCSTKNENRKSTSTNPFF